MTRLTSNERAQIKLPSYTFNCLIGIVLSDMHIALRNPTANARLIMAQSIKSHHLKYFNIVFAMMSPYCTSGLIPKVYHYTDKRNQQGHSSISFTTMQLPVFNHLHSLFYQSIVNQKTGKLQYIKIVPQNIEKLLTPEGLAHWIIGDESMQNKGLHLNVYGFTITDCTLLMNALTNKWKVTCTIHNTKSGPRIYLDGKSIDIIRPLIKEHINTAIYYKIGL